MTNSTPIGLAILGAGIFAKEAHIPALVALQSNNKSPFKLLATYSRSHKSSSDLASFANDELKLDGPPNVYSDDSGSGSNLDALLKRSDIHAVIILLPITVQPAIILKCLKAGKHVLSEKPVAPSVSEGRKLISSAEKYTKGDQPVIWKIAENFECELGTLKAHQLLTEGKIGKVTSFSIEALNDLQKDSKYYQTPWRTVPGYQGGFLLDGGVHSAALVRSIIPIPLDEKDGAKITGWAGLVRDYLEPADTMNVTVNFGSGKSDPNEQSHIAPDALGTFNLTFAAASSEIGKKRNGFDIFGTEGWMEIRNTSAADGKRITKISVHQTQTSKEGERSESVDEHEVEGNLGVIKELEYFFREIGGEASEEEKSFGNPKNALWDVAFIEAGLNSKGKVVNLGDLVSS